MTTGAAGQGNSNAELATVIAILGGGDHGVGADDHLSAIRHVDAVPSVTPRDPVMRSVAAVAADAAGYLATLQIEIAALLEEHAGAAGPAVVVAGRRAAGAAGNTAVGLHHRTPAAEDHARAARAGVAVYGFRRAAGRSAGATDDAGEGLDRSAGA